MMKKSFEIASIFLFIENCN